MKRTILIAGGTGFIGSRLVDHLDEHECIVLARRPPADSPPPHVTYRPYADLHLIPHADVVINLAGESVAGIWTRERKRRILESRVETTRRLVDWMSSLSTPPKVFLSGSAIGYYGDRPGEPLTENSLPDPAKGFRYQVCLAWENEAAKATEHGTRIVLLRIGNVLDPSGGVLKTLLPYLRGCPFLIPVAPNGMTPCISIDDVVRLANFCIDREDIEGPVNVVAPQADSWRNVVTAIGRGLGKPILGHIPNAIVRLALGEFSHSMLDSQDVRPAKALENGFQFLHERPLEVLEARIRCKPGFTTS